MVINPTHLAQRTRQSVNWADAQRRVLKNYREWIRSAPEIQTMYSLNIPVSALRTKIRQEFERHRYVNQIQVVDTLLFQSHAEYQVRRYLPLPFGGEGRKEPGYERQGDDWIISTHSRIQVVYSRIQDALEETLNYWKQLPHILKYFRAEEDVKARRPTNFMNGFLEASLYRPTTSLSQTNDEDTGSQLSVPCCFIAFCTFAFRMDQNQNSAVFHA
ncbi:NADH-ubiquinone oxidoreductase 14.8 kDa subunit [Drepanopeziza brunnea f. sp. 'multigermtubi' MB_m1]|uniref:NADH-ubiquinone oxidoreductase 14.8 kDa subunit n=1 Tax=Marssonina brunnea f. sp. multigermtubi (strain MB_m1) TaxID=1072389 RepID=K1WXU0_MARBU|nr:NADH-ubiquinone oxidoreductase 14.8 kDa subunit [Drepanopeziza brunnea f. sp. 'multigermtubi' MB_m1]EKD17856.1 NADH-ubiquinone oxidoreductase 14.8 kDa subunit [Drepanopeziza brunnea f. sp. 'multigermtubi' MB_m1]